METIVSVVRWTSSLVALPKKFLLDCISHVGELMFFRGFFWGGGVQFSAFRRLWMSGYVCMYVCACAGVGRDGDVVSMVRGIIYMGFSSGSRLHYYSDG